MSKSPDLRPVSNKLLAEKKKIVVVFCTHRLSNAYFCIRNVQADGSVLILYQLSFLLLSAKTFISFHML